APKIINVVSPKTHQMLVKRVQYARRIALGELPLKVPFSVEFAAELPRTATFLSCVSDSFAKSKKLSNLFDLVSNGNARDLLMHVRQVLTCQHLNTEKIVNMFLDRGYTIAEHE